MPKESIALNGINVEVESRVERPRTLMMTENIGVKATMPSGEVVDIVRVFGNPFVFILRGEKIDGSVDFRPIIQEALIHVAKENAR